MTAPHTPQWLRDAVGSIGARWLNRDVSSSEADDLITDEIQERHNAGDPYGRSVWLGVARKERTRWFRQVKDKEGEAEAERLLTGISQKPLFDLPFPLLGGEVSVGFGRMVRQLDLDYKTALAARKIRANQQANYDAAAAEWLADMDKLLTILEQDPDKALRDFVDQDDYEEGYG